MFFNKSLYDKILRELAKNNKHTISSLHEVINKKEPISLPNFYKIINKFLYNQILTKEKWEIRLHSSRIVSLFELNDIVKENYIEKNTMKLDLKEDEQKIFYSSSLIDLDNIWSNILNNMALKNKDNDWLFMYNSHAYHILWLPETESANFKNMKNQVWKVFLLVGNESTMDLYASEQIKTLWINVVCNQENKFLKNWYFINIIWEYILEVLFPNIINQYFNIFFDNIENIKNFNPEWFKNIFEMKGEYKITFRRSKKQSTILKKEIKNYFW